MALENQANSPGITTLTYLWAEKGSFNLGKFYENFSLTSQNSASCSGTPVRQKSEVRKSMRRMMEFSWPRRPAASLVTAMQVSQSTSLAWGEEKGGQKPRSTEQSSGERKYGKSALARSGKWCSVNLRRETLTLSPLEGVTFSSLNLVA